MSDALILHHYARSPFAEKVRMVLGFKGLAWHGVEVPIMLPKPDVVALTGGYRRTPFLQVGADIYCDTALICRLLDRLAPEPPLYPESAGGQQQVLAQWGDTTLFWVAVPYTMRPPGAAELFADEPAGFMPALGADRAAMTAGMRRPTGADAGAQLASYLGWLESVLADGRPYLLGALPCIADFAVAHPLWFMRLAPSVAGMLDAYPLLKASNDRVQAFSRPAQSEFGSGHAIEIAALAAAGNRHARCAVEPGLGFAKGQPVTVSATDYAADPIAGTLVGLTLDSVTIERTDERAGRVHVHFPRIGYQLKKAEEPT